MEVLNVIGIMVTAMAVASAIAAGLVTTGFVMVGLAAMIEWLDHPRAREEYTKRMWFAAKGLIASILACGFGIGIAVSIGRYL